MTKKIQLTQNQVALVDDEDFEYLSQWKWYARWSTFTETFYAASNKAPMDSMHAQIMKTPKGMRTDHIDGNTLNNQKSNLRICTHAENLRNRGKGKNNTSGYKGVSKHNKKWRVRIGVDNRVIRYGCYDTPELAARAYDELAKKYFGEFARLNFPE
jgi:hypothetical protein